MEPGDWGTLSLLSTHVHPLRDLWAPPVGSQGEHLVGYQPSKGSLVKGTVWFQQ